MYPEADIPVVAMSVPLQRSPKEPYKIGQALAPLRQQGVMILGSGGIVHNLAGPLRRPTGSSGAVGC